MSPFEALYGQLPPSIQTYIFGTSQIASLDESLQQRQQILSTLKHHLSRAQLRMQHQANQHRQDRIFAVGDWVYLKL